jgi:cysteinyl-tRNA synthetase
MARPADALPDALAALLQARAEARAARDWARSDELRARLAEAGVLVEDTPDGQRWRQGSVVGGRSR